jgi:hypothetical protein
MSNIGTLCKNPEADPENFRAVLFQENCDLFRLDVDVLEDVVSRHPKVAKLGEKKV